MSEQFQPIAELLTRVRRRWRWQTTLETAARAVFGVAALSGVALALAYAASQRPAGLAAIAIVMVAGALAAIGWTVWRTGRAPSDRRVARFIEERDPSLDDRLVSAVAVATERPGAEPPRLAASMIADAARAAEGVSPSAIVPAAALRRASLVAAGSCCLLLLLLIGGRDLARRSWDALAFTLFPSRISLEVLPGDARVESGSTLSVRARLVGNRAPAEARLLTRAGDADGPGDWSAAPMAPDGAGGYRLDLEGLRTSFQYKVEAGSVSSASFDVSVVRAPRVARIDLEYAYPKALALPPRVETDSGDIYAPEGTDVKIRVHTDAPADTGRLNLASKTTLDLRAESPTLLTGQLRVSENGSYRIALTGEGFSSEGETEYFIRILDDRPPDVRVVRPASDRRVTPLEEVEVTAEAQDDFGISSLDLVYSIKGGPEQAVRLGIAPRSTSVSGRYVFYLEDLDVSPGDLVAYYARARDLARGKPASESRSDIFFLEVKPFEEEFTLAQTQAAMAGGSGDPQLDDLVAAQKEVVAATWKLDRRSRDAQGARSEQDIRAVAKVEGELKVRVEQTSSSFRTSSLRDPRRSRPSIQPGGPPQPLPPSRPDAPPVGQTTSEEDAMTQASAAMGRAVTSLDRLKTSDALPHELEALNALLRAQSDVRKRQVQQQAGSGSGRNRSTEDLSSLFDKELAKNQQTNYETRTSTEQQDDEEKSLADRVKDLAQRQDELVRRQQQLARNRDRMTADEARRELERLTRDQNELRERAEDVGRDLSKQRSEARGGSDEDRGGQQAGQSGARAAGQEGQAGSQGQGAQGESQGQGQGGGDRQKMQDISNEMRNAASDLRRENAEQASARAARALDKLRELERQLQGGSAEGRRRAMGDLQLEARQLAEAQRQIAAESAKTQQDDAGRDQLRRLAGEQERVAERLRRVEQSLKQQAAEARQSQAPRPGQTERQAQQATDRLRQAAADAAREIGRQRLPERMQQSADSMRKAAEAPSPTADATSPPRAATQTAAQEDLARALERLADSMGVAEVPMDDETRRLNEQVARVRELREQMDELGRRLQNLEAEKPDERGGGQDDSNRAGSAGRSGQTGQAEAGSTGDPTDVERLRTDLNQQIQQVGQLLRDAQRGGPSNDNGGSGTTLQGQGMVLSAPGTQGFKQDFARWPELARQITLALDNVEASLAQRLQGKAAKDRLASGIDEKVAAEYQQQVDSYFKALATRKRP